jgi:hypothetical protein
MAGRAQRESIDGQAQGGVAPGGLCPSGTPPKPGATEPGLWGPKDRRESVRVGGERSGFKAQPALDGHVAAPAVGFTRWAKALAEHLSQRRKEALLISRCPSLATMVQSADLRDRHNSPHLRWAQRRRFWQILGHTV